MYKNESSFSKKQYFIYNSISFVGQENKTSYSSLKKKIDY